MATSQENGEIVQCVRCGTCGPSSYEWTRDPRTGLYLCASCDVSGSCTFQDVDSELSTHFPATMNGSPRFGSAIQESVREEPTASDSSIYCMRSKLGSR